MTLFNWISVAKINLLGLGASVSHCYLSRHSNLQQLQIAMICNFLPFSKLLGGAKLHSPGHTPEVARYWVEARQLFSSILRSVQAIAWQSWVFSPFRKPAQFPPLEVSRQCSGWGQGKMAKLDTSPWNFCRSLFSYSIGQAHHLSRSDSSKRNALQLSWEQQQNPIEKIHGSNYAHTK